MAADIIKKITEWRDFWFLAPPEYHNFVEFDSRQFYCKGKGDYMRTRIRELMQEGITISEFCKKDEAMLENAILKLQTHLKILVERKNGTRI